MSKLHRAVFPGSFNPLHDGHLNIIKRAAHLFEYLYVAVSINIDKKNKADIRDRFQKVKNIIDKKLKLKNVKVVLNNGLTINLLKKFKCQYIVRSIRGVRDIQYEINMAQNNHLLANKIETIFFVSSNKLKKVSSSNLRELIRQKRLIKKGS
ncbi:MAG: pantetheine-phosphate adenylyltransferase [Mycoplasmataceae bacterium]|jgi:pantetheine-phosphate adenylyltransferase|nr:pantetheine-phosphate adenylyltransferase [Mycoplasmataceae bacterium]